MCYCTGNWLIKKKSFVKNINRAYAIDEMKLRYSKLVVCFTTTCLVTMYSQSVFQILQSITIPMI